MLRALLFVGVLASSAQAASVKAYELQPGDKALPQTTHGAHKAAADAAADQARAK